LPHCSTRRLPAGLGIAQVADAPRKFSAQWKATGKEYRYRLLLADDSAWSPYAWRVDVEPTRSRSCCSGRWAPGTSGRSTRRPAADPPHPLEVELVEVAPGRVDVRLTGQRFGRYQVRYLVGGAVAVARGELPEEAFVAGAGAGDRVPGDQGAGPGLTLWESSILEFDPFPAAVRAAAAGVPRQPPFI